MSVSERQVKGLFKSMSQGNGMAFTLEIVYIYLYCYMNNCWDDPSSIYKFSNQKLSELKPILYMILD